MIGALALIAVLVIVGGWLYGRLIIGLIDLIEWWEGQP